MRVTDGMIFTAAARTAQDARARMNAAMDESATGLRVARPGDDPAAAGLAVSHRYAAERLAAVGETAKRAADELAAADNALGSLGDLVTRAQELAVQQANGTWSAEQRQTAAAEAASLADQAIALLNARHGARYLFGGTADGAPPFDAAGGYHGNAAVRQVELAPGVLADAAVRADGLAGGGGGANVPGTLRALATALEGNDLAGLRGTLDALAAGVSQVATARATAGARMAALDTAAGIAKSAQDALTAEVSRLEDADPIDAATRLALAQRALEASLAASASSFRLTLLDRL